MQQYFFDDRVEVGESVTLKSTDDIHHMKKVMRYRIGDTVELVSDGVVYVGEFVTMDDQVTLMIQSQLDKNVELPVLVTLIQGLPKNDKMDFIVQKSTELGVSEIIPWQAKRSIVDYDHKKREKKKIRWQKIAKEAAEQAHRNQIPVIDDVATTEMLKQIVKNFDAVYILSEVSAKENQNSASVKSVLMQNVAQNKKIACIIGPEGGFDDSEIAFFEYLGAIACHLGPRILRTETASMYILSAISILFEM